MARRPLFANSKFTRIALLVFGVLFVLVGAAGFINGARAYPIERDTRRWAMTWGTLDYARFDASRHSIVIRYTFSVNGIKHVGNRISYGIQYGGHDFVLENKAEDFEQQQRAAGRTAVYYDPRDPSKNCLEIGVSGSIACVVVGVVAFLVGVSAIYRALWPKRCVGTCTAGGMTPFQGYDLVILPTTQGFTLGYGITPLPGCGPRPRDLILPPARRWPPFRPRRGRGRETHVPLPREHDRAGKPPTDDGFLLLLPPTPSRFCRARDASRSARP